MHTNTFSFYKQQLRIFSESRDWGKFHTPKNLAMALTSECGELSDILKWLSDSDIQNLEPIKKKALMNELADIFICSIRLADVLNFDIEEIIEDKIKINVLNYPVSLSKGKSTKYSEFK